MSDTRRLFFALPLPPKTQRALVKWRAEQFPPEAGRPIAAANLHITLAFLGDVSEQKSLALQNMASRIKQPAFSLDLDDAGHWPGAGVVWLGSRRAPRGLLQLAELLRSQAARSGCYQSPFPFHPHVTLLRGATKTVAIPPSGFHWPVAFEHFALYSSEFRRGRTRYDQIACWPLITQTKRGSELSE
ncbi:RNA 2',3'-cyclic phosphodiesterase [Hafnia paralvei]|uniref:RNA 2',3'-cyclic phosphodiesterase n=1 Tax=Hafnia paralvei TaxID=546367 RepID=UPI00107A256B|nr:RNA 2',3'-cyclic phosphodiesterase [Hafnia paralvei]